MRRMFAGLTTVAVRRRAERTGVCENRNGERPDYRQSCYMKDKANNAGKDHKMPKGDTADCAAMCAKTGAPMAMLTDDGKVYQLTGGLAADKNAKIIPHVAHVVEVTGDVTEKDGKMMIAADSLTMVSR